MATLRSIGLSRLAAVFDQAELKHLSLQVNAMNVAAAAAEINTPNRWAMWLAQLGVETEDFLRFEENLNYGSQALLALWPKHFDAATSLSYARQPERIANRAYADRMGNGDEASGDGWKYRGRGAIQITGLDEYRACAKDLDIDLVARPEIAADGARFLVAASFWRAHGLNQSVDAGDVMWVTKIVNGGLNGILKREALYANALPLLTAAAAA